MDTTSERTASMRDRLAIDYGWTPRQREVLDLVARGQSNQQIADTLGISLDGAKWHMREILSKLNVDTREEAAEYWRRYNGLGSRFARVFRGAFGSSAARWGAGGLAAVTLAGGGAIFIAAGQSEDADAGPESAPTNAETEPTSEAAAGLAS